MSKRKFYTVCDIFVYLLVKKKVFLFFYWKAFLIKCVRKSNINFPLPLSVFLNQFLSLRYYDICKIIYLRVERIGFSLPKSALFYICDLLDMFLLLWYARVQYFTDKLTKKTRDKFFQYLNFAIRSSYFYTKNKIWCSINTEDTIRQASCYTLFNGCLLPGPPSCRVKHTQKCIFSLIFHIYEDFSYP